MEHIFYLLTIFPILWEAIRIINISKTHSFAIQLKNMKVKKYDEYSSTQKTFITLQFGYMIWIFIGFFSFQWVAFLLLFLLGFIPKKYIWYSWIDALISYTILIFIVINAYHFKIDLWQLIVKL